MRLFLLLMAFLGVTNLFGKNYFLLYDSGCMDRLEYSYEETRPGNEFIMYSIDVGNGEKIILEVGLESRAPIRSLNSDVLLSCDGASNILQADLAEKINNKIDKVYIVSPANMQEQYKVAVVNSAAYFKYQENILIANTPQYRFEYDFTGTQSGGDLSQNDPRGSVYYIEDLPLGPCTASAFRQTFGRENNYMDIYVVPEIGVVEEKSSQANTSFRLTKVNNTPFADYVYRICGGAQARYDTQQSGPDSYNDRSSLRSKGPRQAAKPAVMHVVTKGETLFSITKEYGISLSDIKVWNDLSTDVIYPGDQLIVSPAIEASAGDLAAKGVESYNDADAVFGDQGPSGMPAWTQTSGQHLVQAGETVGTIARMYGYTEERFRYFNGLAPTTRVKEGDILQTIDCPDGAQGSLQTKGGVSSYSMNPATNPEYTYGTSTPGYRYTNEQNDPYKDEFIDFDREYPSEFQKQEATNVPQEGMSNAPDSYNYPPGFSPKSPQSAADENFYSPSNYGPVAGSYNNNAPLREPTRNVNLNQADPTDYRNYVRGNTQNTGPTNYGAVPNQNQRGTQMKGLPSNYDTLPLTGVKKMHTVQEGETLQSIARKYGTTVDRLRRLNQMNKNEIVIPFQQIYVQK